MGMTGSSSSKTGCDFGNRDDCGEAQKHQEREGGCTDEDAGDGNVGIVERRPDRIDRPVESSHSGAPDRC